MPAYKADGFIAQSVSSVLNQSYKNWEIILVADDENDYEAVLAKNNIADKRIKYFSTGQTGSGPSKARNLAIDNAAGEVIALLDCDDEFHPQKLELMVPKALEYGLATCAFENVRYENGTKEILQFAECRNPDKLLNLENFLATNFSTNSLSIYDRKRLNLYYPTYLNYLEDLIFSVSAFDYVEHTYHFSDKLHNWVYRASSLSHAADAPKQFIAAKKLVLGKISSGEITLRNKSSIAELERFIINSLQAEERFNLAAASNMGQIDFIDFFIKEISALYPKKEYAYKDKTYINGKINPTEY